MILTTIDGMPLYSTTTEAVAHAIRIGLQGYHMHSFKSRIGYMAGVNHTVLSRNTKKIQTNTNPPQAVVTQNNPTTLGNTGGGY